MAKRRFNIEILGCALALLIVIAVPLCLGLLPVDVSSSAGPAVATGDASAVSLHALGRSLHTDTLPALVELCFVGWDTAAIPTHRTWTQAPLEQGRTISTLVGASAARLL